MNDQLLLRRIVKIPNQNVKFLSFIHPDFSIITDVDDINPGFNGIIYTGAYSDAIVDKLKSMTNKWIIVNDNHADTDISTNEGLIKAILPVVYNKLRRLKDETYKQISYSQLIDRIKICLITSQSLDLCDSVEQSSYELYCAILGPDTQLSKTFFQTVTEENIGLITSSILTFLNKVQSMSIVNASPQYTRLIIQSNRKYGKHISKAISLFVKSKSDRVSSLYKLLTFLNKPR